MMIFFFVFKVFRLVTIKNGYCIEPRTDDYTNENIFLIKSKETSLQLNDLEET